MQTDIDSSLIGINHLAEAWAHLPNNSPNTIKERIALAVDRSPPPYSALRFAPLARRHEVPMPGVTNLSRRAASGSVSR